MRAVGGTGSQASAGMLLGAAIDEVVKDDSSHLCWLRGCGGVNRQDSDCGYFGIILLPPPLSEFVVVVRDGAVVDVMAADLVPGDIVVLDSGSRVPADLRLIDCFDLRFAS